MVQNMVLAFLCTVMFMDKDYVKLQRLSLRKPLPVIDGLGPSMVWLPPGRWERIIDFLCDHFPMVSKTEWRHKMNAHEVVDDKGTPWNPESLYQSGCHLFYYREIPHEPPIPFGETILYEDDNLIVVDKPHFVPTIPAGRFLHQSLLVRLQKRLGREHLVPIHRLDRETAGVVVFCKNPEQRGAYQTLFKEGLVDKKYEAIAAPLPRVLFPHTRSSCIQKGTPFFRMCETQGPPNSHTLIRVIAQGHSLWKYLLCPKTGKKHQLRLHMAALGAPIVNDRFYPILQKKADDRYEQPLQLLARSIAFVDPICQTAHVFVSEQQLSHDSVHFTKSERSKTDAV